MPKINRCKGVIFESQVQILRGELLGMDCNNSNDLLVGFSM